MSREKKCHAPKTVLVLASEGNASNQPGCNRFRPLFIFPVGRYLVPSTEGSVCCSKMQSDAALHVFRYGVNPGSALAILGNSSVAALAAVNTTISASAATMSAMGVFMFRSYRETGQGTWDLLGSANGTLGGLVAITAGVTPLS
jgi:Ammonium Transporter Family